MGIILRLHTELSALSWPPPRTCNLLFAAVFPDARRQTDDLSRQEERRRDVRVRGDKHGGGEGQRPRRAGGLW